MIKMTCERCGYIARASRKLILNQGPVLCPCNQEPMSFEIPDEETESEES